MNRILLPLVVLSLAGLAPGDRAAAAEAAPVGADSGRLLSSSCFQCHSAGGFEGITGESASEISSELREMRARRTPEGIMDLIARGLTDAQIAEISAYLATLPKSNNPD